MLFVFLRRHMKTILTGTIIIITPAFVMWGTGTGTGSSLSSAVALRINDEDISPKVFAREVQRAERFVGRDLAVTTAIDTLLDDYVVRQACAELDIEVTPGEVQDQIKQDPAFRNADGSFSAEKWNRMLRHKNVNWATRIEASRRQLQRQKLFDLIRASVQVAPTEIRARYDHDNARRRVAYAIFDPADFAADVAVDEDNLITFFEANAAQYEEPTQIRLNLVQWPKTPSEADTIEVQALLSNLQVQLMDGADFAELAEQYSQGPSAAKGGDLGYFTRDRMIPAFAEVAFALAPGQISDPVLTRFGWHLIKVEDRREGENGPEVRARHILIKNEPSVDALAERLEAAKQFRESIMGRPLADAATEADLTVIHTEPFAESAITIPEVGQAGELVTAAFDLEPGAVTDVIDLPDAFVVAEVTERIPAHLPALDEIRDRVAADYRLERAGDRVAARAAAVAEEARTRGDLAAVEPSLTGPVTETDWFTRVGFVPTLGRSPTFMETAFRLEPGDVSEPIPYGQRWLVVQVREAAPADPAGFDDQAASLRQRLEQQWRVQAIQDFLIARKAKLVAIPNADIVAQFGGA